MGEMIVSIICVALLCIGWIPLIGLKVLKPQEAWVARDIAGGIAKGEIKEGEAIP